MLKDTLLEPNFPMRLLAQRSVGMSGSDLRELCRNAAMLPVREYVRETSTDQEALAKGQLEVGRPFSARLFIACN
jgi:SpoVK/Ycf46/Vps4 family AAA+-type ATPase